MCCRKNSKSECTIFLIRESEFLKKLLKKKIYFHLFLLFFFSMLMQSFINMTLKFITLKLLSTKDYSVYTFTTLFIFCITCCIWKKLI